MSTTRLLQTTDSRSAWFDLRRTPIERRDNLVGQKLDSGDAFPEFTLNTIEGSTITLPNDVPTDYAVVLFYRGFW